MTRSGASDNKIMKIMINTSNLKTGGALQVAYSFLAEQKRNREDIFHVVLSNELAEQVDINVFPTNFKFYRYSIKPGLITALWGKDNFLSQLEQKIHSNCVFTVFGPSYWIPNSPHLIGYAIAHYIYPESPYFKSISTLSRVYIEILKRIQKFNLTKKRSHYWVEANEVRTRLSKFLRINVNDINTISNTYNLVFENYLSTQKKVRSGNSNDGNEYVFRFVTITSYYPHKNLEILKKVIPVLRSRDILCNFQLTLDVKSFEGFTDFSDYITNIGPVPITDCPALYDNSDALFLPTLLECFSASYPESMKMGKPILTSDLPFAHDICGDAAEYFDPLDPFDIANKIEKVMNDDNARDTLIQNGYRQLLKFDTPASRAEKLMHIIQRISI